MQSSGIYISLRGPFSQMGRITQQSTIADIVDIMSGGAIGTTVLMHRILQQPDAMQLILQLDHCEIYGSDLWIAYNYMCNTDLTALCDLIRSMSVGKTPHVLVKEIIAEVTATGNVNIAKLAGGAI